MHHWALLSFGFSTIIVITGCSATSNDRAASGQGSGAGAAGSSAGSAGSGGFHPGAGGLVVLEHLQGRNDLKQVVNCRGNVIETCQNGDACAFGVCTNDPCAAAQKSGSSTGCEFWALKTDVIFQGNGACFAAFIANTWSSPAHIEVTRQGAALPVSAIKMPRGKGST